MVPADYDIAVFLDIRTVSADPRLREIIEGRLDRESLGPGAALLLEQVEAVVIALKDRNVLGAVRGPLTKQSLINLLKAPGTDVESQSYGASEISRVETAYPPGIKVAMSRLDDTTLVFRAGLSPKSSSTDLVKASLDTVAGSMPGYYSVPAVKQLLEMVPQGFAVMVALDCSRFGKFTGCTALSISSKKEGEDAILHWVFQYWSPTMAQAALLALKEQAARDAQGPSKPLEPVQITREGNTVRMKARVAISESLPGLLGLGGD